MDDLKVAVRSLLSTPGPTLVVIVTLAIAIGANTAIFSVVRGVLLSPMYPQDDRLVVPWAVPSGGGKFRLSPADYRDLRDSVDAFAGEVLLYRSMGSTLTGLDRPQQIGSLVVTSRIFDVLRATPAAGQFFTDQDEEPGAPRRLVITHESWTRRFGADPALIGSIVELDGMPYTLVGVTEPGFQFPPSDADIEAYFPMGLSDNVLLDRDHRMFDSVARLADGVSLTAARSELTAFAAQLAREFPDTNAGWDLTAQPMRSELLGDLATTLWVLSGAVFLVLLTACANVANVLIARSSATSREFAVRAALGAGRGDLCRRSLAESTLLGACGAIGGVLLAMWGVSLLRSVIPADIPRAELIGLDGAVLLFAALLSLGATLLFGLLPALRSMAPDLNELLKPAGAFGSGAGGGRRLRELMVVVEVALAIVLLVGAGLMIRSFGRLSAVDPGFRQEDLVSVAVKLPTSRYARSEWRPFFEQMVQRVNELPGVTGAGAVSALPMSNIGLDFELEFTVLGLDAVSPTERPNAEIRLLIPGYFGAMDMQILNGRDFDSLDAERPVAVINQTLAERYFQELDPIGRAIDVLSLGELQIIGVVADTRSGGLQSLYESEIFVPFGRIRTIEMHVVAASSLETGAVASAIGDVLTDMDPELAPSEVAAMEDRLWESVAQPRFNTALLSGLALCAALLAVVGTYGIVAYSVSQRTTEIGVRMALGADSAATVAMIVRQALRIVVVGAAVGVVGALGATRFLGQLLFDVRPTDPLTYGVVVVAAVAVGALAAWTPARRATRVDPVTALRDA